MLPSHTPSFLLQHIRFPTNFPQTGINDSFLAANSRFSVLKQAKDKPAQTIQRIYSSYHIPPPVIKFFLLYNMAVALTKSKCAWHPQGDAQAHEQLEDIMPERWLARPLQAERCSAGSGWLREESHSGKMGRFWWSVLPPLAFSCRGKRAY